MERSGFWKFHEFFSSPVSSEGCPFFNSLPDSCLKKRDIRDETDKTLVSVSLAWRIWKQPCHYFADWFFVNHAVRDGKWGIWECQRSLDKDQDIKHGGLATTNDPINQLKTCEKLEQNWWKKKVEASSHMGRRAWNVDGPRLKRMEEDQTQRGKTVRELEEISLGHSTHHLEHGNDNLSVFFFF